MKAEAKASPAMDVPRNKARACSLNKPKTRLTAVTRATSAVDPSSELLSSAFFPVPKGFLLILFGSLFSLGLFVFRGRWNYGLVFGKDETPSKIGDKETAS